MKFSRCMFGFFLCAITPTPVLADAVCLDFEPPLAAGSVYGTPSGHSVGDVVFTTHAIPVAVDFFLWSTGTGTFDFAEIATAPAPFGSGNAVHTNNINLIFDFTGYDARPSKLTLNFLDLGGVENFAVNGCPPFVGQIETLQTSMCATDVSTSVSPVSGGSTGTLEIKGYLLTMKIGGQEFWIDDICLDE